MTHKMKGSPAESAHEAYKDAQTAMAMAKGEAWAMREFLRNRAVQLREEADEIDRFLANATKETDTWYDEIVARRDASRGDV